MSTEISNGRTIVDLLDREFRALLHKLNKLVEFAPPELLYKRPPRVTIGENILRSAALIEQVFGGLTTNLWDDPFEWTLPETLSTPDKIIQYLREVADARGRMFAALTDESLLKLVALPSGEERTVIELLLEALLSATDYHGAAVATVKMLSDVDRTRVII
jgi:hypothetical protein